MYRLLHFTMYSPKVEERNFIDWITIICIIFLSLLHNYDLRYLKYFLSFMWEGSHLSASSINTPHLSPELTIQFCDPCPLSSQDTVPLDFLPPNGIRGIVLLGVWVSKFLLESDPHQGDRHYLAGPLPLPSRFALSKFLSESSGQVAVGHDFWLGFEFRLGLGVRR